MNETLKQIHDCAKLQLHPFDVELILNLDENQLSKNDEMAKAYRQGRAEGKRAILTSIMTACENGDARAAKILHDISEQTDPDSLD